MKCCEECPEYEFCEEKTGCCDMCDLYNPKTKRCSKKGKKRKEGEEVLSRKKIEKEEEDEDLDSFREDAKKIRDEYDNINPYGEDELNEFYET